MLIKLIINIVKSQISHNVIDIISLSHSSTILHLPAANKLQGIIANNTKSYRVLCVLRPYYSFVHGTNLLLLLFFPITFSEHKF